MATSVHCAHIGNNLKYKSNMGKNERQVEEQKN